MTTGTGKRTLRDIARREITAGPAEQTGTIDPLFVEAMDAGTGRHTLDSHATWPHARPVALRPEPPAEPPQAPTVQPRPVALLAATGLLTASILAAVATIGVMVNGVLAAAIGVLGIGGLVWIAWEVHSTRSPD